jgi:hypothetical protein
VPDSLFPHTGARIRCWTHGLRDGRESPAVGFADELVAGEEPPAYRAVTLVSPGPVTIRNEAWLRAEALRSMTCTSSAACPVGPSAW